MASNMIENAALGAFFLLLFEELSPIIKKQLGLCWGVNSELEKLEEKLLTIQAVLDDAERRYAEPLVNCWLDSLKELAYEMHDIVDEMIARRSVLEHGGRSQDQVRAFKKAKFVTWALDKYDEIKFKIAVKSRISKILESLDQAVKDADRFGLRRHCIGLSSGLSQTRLSPETSPSVDESEVYGREEDKKEIIKMLFAKDDQKKKNYTVIPIVGMGGLGKTTLAQLVFKDEHVMEQFNLRSWACVSDVFDVSRVTKELLEYSTNEHYGDMPLAKLQDKLENLVRGKRFLMVLDDIWTVKEWDGLKASLNCCEKGSMVLVTTWSHQVATAMSNRSPYEIRELNFEHCWALFQDKAFGGVDTNINGNLTELGKGIVKKCRGVPLAVKVLGAMLRGAEQERWEAVLKNELWQLENDEDQIFHVLRLSYHYLPSPLKRCFEYFALFPADHLFAKDKLVSMWICEGLVEAKEGRLLEDIGSQYFDDLKIRCLIQKNHMVHDLVHKLACVASGEFYCRLQCGKKSCQSLARARHASILGNYGEVDFGLLSEAKSLRTMVVFESYSQNSLLGRLSEWRLLRVLDLAGINIPELPRSIGGLKHLRYLNLSGREWSNVIVNLPDELCELYSLQYLILSGCTKLENIPKDVGNLMNLRCLDISWCDCISSLPNSICKLSNLHTLNLCRCQELADLPQDIGNLLNLRNLDFSGTKISMLPPNFGKVTGLQTLKSYPIGKETGRGIGQLKDMNNLRDLVISCLENVDNIQEAETANLKSKKNIKSLRFEWSSLMCNDISVVQDGEVKVKILEALEPNSTALTSLSFIGYNGERLPKWMSTTKFSFLHYLKIESLHRLITVVDIELPLLVKLKIEKCTRLRDVSMVVPMILKVDLRECRKLTNLSLLSSLQESGDGSVSNLSHLPQLKELHIFICPNLRDVSMVVPTISKVVLCGCQELTNLSLLSFLQESGDGSVSNLSTRIHVPQLKEFAIFECPNLRDVSMVVPELKELRVAYCRELNISHALFPCLKWLELKCLPSLTGFMMNSMPPPPPSLNLLIIRYCKKLESLFEDGVPATLEYLEILCCPELIPRGLFRLTSLGRLEIDYHACAQLKASEEVVVPGMMMRNDDDCSSLLNWLPNLTSLQYLTIWEFPQARLPDDGFPAALKRIYISNWPNLTSLPKALHNLTSLEELKVEDCPQLVSFPEEGLPPTLTQLDIENCPKLEYLPKHINNLTSLLISDCPQLELRPDDRLPPNLEYLYLYGDCSKLKQQFQEEDRREWFDLMKPQISGIVE